MGYTTDYAFREVRPLDPETTPSITIEDIARTGIDFGDIEELLCEGWMASSGMWIDEELAAFSAKFPHHVFIVDCQGEDGEKWRAYYNNGLYQTKMAVITYPDYEVGGFDQVLS